MPANSRIIFDKLQFLGQRPWILLLNVEKAGSSGTQELDQDCSTLLWRHSRIISTVFGVISSFAAHLLHRVFLRTLSPSNQVGHAANTVSRGAPKFYLGQDLSQYRPKPGPEPADRVWSQACSRKQWGDRLRFCNG
jgi:hypothetical protein